MIFEVFSSGPVDTNVIIVACERTKKAAIIDAPQDCASFVLPKVKELGVTVEMLLLTHTHQDHIAEVDLLKKKLKMPIYVHALDAPNLESPGADLLPIFIPAKPVTPDHFLEDGQMLMLGDLKFSIIHTPGHTPGCVCFYFEEEKLLISGDTLFRGSMGRIDFPGSNAEAMWNSLKRLAELPSDTRVVPGHGEMTTIKNEAAWMIYRK